MLENFLHPYVEAHPHSWSDHLSLAEFAANNAVNASTGYSPFVLNAGETPTLPEALVVGQEQSSNQAVTDVLQTMKEALATAQQNLVQAQQRTKKQVDRTRRAVEWKQGDQVLLSTRHLRTFATHLPMKLKRRWVGPFTIEQVISPVAYRLDLPQGWQIHPTFHVSHLKAYHRHPEFEREVEPPPPVLVDGELEYEVEAILRHRGKGARRQYLILWKGYPLTEATWEPEEHLLNAPDILADYLRRVQTTSQRTRTTKRREGADEE